MMGRLVVWDSRGVLGASKIAAAGTAGTIFLVVPVGTLKIQPRMVPQKATVLANVVS